MKSSANICIVTSIWNRLFQPKVKPVILTTGGAYYPKVHNGKVYRGELAVIGMRWLLDASKNVCRGLQEFENSEYAKAHTSFDFAVPQLEGIADINEKLRLACQVMKQSFAAIDEVRAAAFFGKICQKFDKEFGPPIETKTSELGHLNISTIF